MGKITVGVLTVSDRCSRNEATDESGECLINMIRNGVIENGAVMKKDLVPDNEADIEKVLLNWCDQGINLILTTGGTGISSTDVTPEATARVVKKTLPGISGLLLERSLEATPFAALSRGIAGVRDKTLIINFPGSKKASRECLEAVAGIIPHAVDLIAEKRTRVERVHATLEERKSLMRPVNPVDRRRESAYPCISVSEAQQIIVKRVFSLIREKVVNYDEGSGYVLAQDVVARDNLPPFDASLKDGYAVLSSDKTPERNMVGISTPGNSVRELKVVPGCCVRISTGAALPPGADAVVKVEDTETAKENQTEETRIILKNLPSKGQDVRPLGSDFKTGQMLLSCETHLDAAAIGLLAAAGVTSVRVFDKPLVGVLSTGDEIAPPGKELTEGKVRDSNRITLISLLREESFKATDLGIAPDEPEALREALECGFRRADVVVTTGSMSMGERDYLKEILTADFNAEICFGRVLMKPGKPTSFGILTFEGKPKLWFGLPGNPASAFVTSHLFLLPALRKISGYRKIFPVRVRAEVDVRNLIPLEDRPQYVRGVLIYDETKNSWFASNTGNQGSSCIESCVNKNCLIELPADPKLENEPKSIKAESKSSATVAPFGFEMYESGSESSAFFKPKATACQTEDSDFGSHAAFVPYQEPTNLRDYKGFKNSREMSPSNIHTLYRSLVNDKLNNFKATECFRSRIPQLSFYRKLRTAKANL